MRLVDSIVAAARRSAAYDAYLEGRSDARGRFGSPAAMPDVPPHWLGLCDALSTDYLARGTLLPAPALWAELLPFLLVLEDDRATGLLLEYISFKTQPSSADLELLGIEINRALCRLDVRDERLTRLLDAAINDYRPPWMAFLSYETLRRTGRLLARARRERTPADVPMLVD